MPSPMSISYCIIPVWFYGNTIIYMKGVIVECSVVCSQLLAEDKLYFHIPLDLELIQQFDWATIYLQA